MLVIDDDDLVRKVLRCCLETAGCSVVEAASGQEGITAYRHAPADLVILDLLLPDMDGLDVLLDLGVDDPGLNVLAISGGNGDLDFLAAAETSGARAVLRKPFDLPHLLQTVRGMVGSPPAAAERRQHARFPVRIPVVFANQSLHGHGFLVDLSLGGCAVESDQIPCLHASLTLYLGVPSQSEPILVDLAAVCWTGDRTFGVHFQWMGLQAQTTVKETLRQLVPCPAR